MPKSQSDPGRFRLHDKGLNVPEVPNGASAGGLTLRRTTGSGPLSGVTGRHFTLPRSVDRGFLDSNSPCYRPERGLLLCGVDGGCGNQENPLYEPGGLMTGVSTDPGGKTLWSLSPQNG